MTDKATPEDEPTTRAGERDPDPAKSHGNGVESRAKPIPDAVRAAIARVQGNPEDDAAWDELDEAARDTQEPDAVAKLYLAVLSGNVKKELANSIGQRAASFHDEWYEAPEGLVQILRLVLEADPRSPWAFERLSLLLTMAERWDDLLAEYDRALAKLTDVTARIELLEEAARIAKDFAGKAKRASDYLIQLLVLKPNDDVLANSLERRLKQQARHADLIEVWRARIGVLNAAEALEVRSRIAKTYLEKLNDAESALQETEALLNEPQGEPHACSLLERLAAQKAASESTRKRSLELLMERYSAANRGTDVVRVIELALSVATKAEDQLKLHREAVRWQVQTDRIPEAITHAAAILVLTPDAKDIHSQLRKLTTKANLHERYADALVAAADGCADAELRISLLTEAGQVREETIRDAAGATLLYRRVLDDAEADAAARLLAAQKLVGLLVVDEQLPERLEVLARLAELEPDASARSSALGEAAGIAEQLGGDDRALLLWQRRLDDDASDLGALDARVRILTRLERWLPLIDDLRLRARQTKSKDTQRADLISVARIQEQELRALPDAIETWNDVRDRFGSNEETTDALVRLCKAAQRWDDVVLLLTEAVDAERDPTRKATELCELGDVLRTTQSAGTRAVPFYARALDINPSHAAGRAGLEALLSDAEAAGPAVETLAAAFRAAGEHRATLGLLERRLGATNDKQKQQAILSEAARTSETESGDLAGALTCLRRAFALLADRDVEGEIARLAESTQGWQVALDAYEEAITAATDEVRAQELLLVQGTLYEQKLSALESALNSYRRIMDTAPEHVPAACAMVSVSGRTRHFDALAWAYISNAAAVGALEEKLRLATETVADELGVWDDLTGALGDLIAQSTLPPSIAHAVNRQLGLWHRDKRRDNQAAERSFESAVLEVQDADTLEMLAALEREHPGPALVRTLLRLSEARGGDLTSLHEAAKVAGEVVRDAQLAEPILEQALGSASTALQSLFKKRAGTQLGTEAEEVATYALGQLVSMARSTGRAARALEILGRGASLPLSDETQIALTYQAAEVAHREIDDDAFAITACRSVLKREPSHMPAIELLGKLLSKAGLTGDLLALRRSELGLEPPLDRRLVLRLEESKLLGELKRPNTERVAVLEKNLEESPGHAETIERIYELLEADGAFEDLHELLTAQSRALASAAHAGQSARLLARAGRIAEQQLGDTGRALNAYRESVRLAPSVDVLDALSRIFIDKGEHAEAVGWLEQRLLLTPTSTDAREARRSTIVLLARSLLGAERADEARTHLAAGLKEDPAATQIREVLVGIHRANNDWAELAPVLADGVQYADNAATKIEYLKDAAHLHRFELDNLTAAIPLLEEAARLAPDDRDLRLSLANALAAGRRYPEAETLLRALLEEFGRRRTPEKAGVHFQLARIARAMGDLETALDQLQSASSIERSDPGILKLLGDVALQNGELERAERSYRALLLILGRQRGKEAGGEEIAESAVLFQLHQIATRMNQEDRARDLLDSAMEAGARGGEERVQLEAVFHEVGEHELHLKFLEQLVGDATGKDRASILLSKGSVLAGLGRKADAFNDYLEAFGIDPRAKGLREAATELATELGELPRLVAHADRLASELSETESKTACDLWMFLATLKAQEKDAFAAAAYLEKAQLTGARPLETFEVLYTALTELGDKHRTAAALRRFIDAPGKIPNPEKLTNALYELVEFELEQEVMLAQAASRLERAIDRDGNIARGVSLLSNALPLHPPNEEAARLLERLARETNEPLALLEALAATARLGSVTIQELEEATNLCRAEGTPERARPFLERAVEVAEERGQQKTASWAFSELAEIVLGEGDAKRAARLLKIAVGGAADSEAFPLWIRLGTIAQGPLDDLKLAQKCFEHLFRDHSGNPEVWQPLFAVYRKAGKVRRLENALASTESVVTDPELRAALRVERINLLVDTNRGEEAETELREILQLTPEDERAAALLTQLLETGGRKEELRELVQGQYDAARDKEDPKAIARHALKLGALLLEVDKQQAMDLYQNALNWCASSREVLNAVLALYEPEIHDSEHADALEMLLALETGEAAEKTALTLIAMRERQGDQIAVGKALEIGFQACPTSTVLRDRLVAWYESEQDWARLAELYLLDAQNRQDPKQAFDRFKLAAGLFYDKVSDAARAAEALQGAHALRPLDIEVLNTLTGYLSESGNPDGAKAIVTQTIEQHPTDDATTAILYHLRGALRAKDGIDDRAALALAALDLEKAVTLGRVDAKADVVTVLEQLQSLQVDEPEARRVTVMRLAKLMPEFERLDDAVDLLADWANDHMEDVGALSLLGMLAMRGGHWETAGGAYMQLVTLLDGQGQIDTALLMANAWENAGAPLNAKESLEAIYAQAPDNEVVRQRLFQMYLAAGAHQELAAMYLGQVDETTDDERRFRLLCDAGALLLRVDGAADDALAVFARALEIKPGEPEVTVLVANAQLAKGEVEKAGATLSAAIDAQGKRRTPVLSQLQQAMARVSAAAGDIEAQFKWLDGALQSDRQNGGAAADLAILAMDRENYDLAVKALQIVTLLKETGPMSRAEAYLRQGMIANIKGDPRKAVLLAKRALSTDPDYQAAKDFLVQLG